LKRGPFGGDLKKAFFVGQGIPVYEQYHAINNDFENNRYFIDEDRYKLLKACNVGPGDYIVSCSGTMGKIARLPKNASHGIINQALLRIRINEEIIGHNYFIQFFKSSLFRKKILKDSRGSGMQNMAGIREIKPVKLNLPPLPIQRAIVSKIECLFSSLDSGIADLIKAQAQLKIYRQAVLKKAFEGELTKEWREQQTDLPSAEELLELISEERQAYFNKQIKEWNANLRLWEENGKVGKKPSKPKHLKDFKLSHEVKSDLPILSKEFLWLPIGNIFSDSPLNGIYKSSSEYGSGLPIIRIDNFYAGVISPSITFKRLRIRTEEINKYQLRQGQVLINRVNSIDYLGKSGLVGQLDELTVFESNIMKLSLLENLILPKFLVLFLTSVTGMKEIRRFAKHAVNQASINQTDVSLTPLPFCSKGEQHQIVKEIESRLSVCDKVEKDIKDSLVKSTALRQSILKKAFEGKLLTKEEIEKCKQEADYEPASVLLERIKKEKVN